MIDPTTQVEIITSLSEKLRAYYINPDIAEQLCACLHQHLEAGDYTGITEGEFFAYALTTHMQEVNAEGYFRPDEHLWVRWHVDPLPDTQEALRLNKEWQEEKMLEARLDHYGIHKLERLAGNIGYIDLRYFHRLEWGADTVNAAMSFLADSSALIFDLRQCSGGYPAMIALVCSYLFGKEPVHLSSIYWRDEDTTQEFWTSVDIPGKHFGDMPVYVLTSKATFSAGEAFASILQARKRAVVIGEKTDGGGHPGASYRLHAHFEAFIPIGRVFDPVTGKDLEGVGVTPDVLLPKEQAFEAAYHMALEIASSLRSSQ
jgi:C-terminal processing protease CtpA/Prc